MKTIKFSVLSVILTIILFSSCKKDSNPTKANTETPVKSVIEAKTVTDQLLTEPSAESLELGYKFSSSKAGKITQLGCLYPVKGNVLVSLWDFDTKVLLATTTVSITDITKFAYTNIPSIDITANKSYVISINTNIVNGLDKPIYKAKKVNGAAVFPFAVGNINFENALYKSSTIVAFPTNATNQFILGIADFVIEY